MDLGCVAVFAMVWELQTLEDSVRFSFIEFYRILGWVYLPPEKFDPNNCSGLAAKSHKVAVFHMLRGHMGMGFSPWGPWGSPSTKPSTNGCSSPSPEKNLFYSYWSTNPQPGLSKFSVARKNQLVPLEWAPCSEWWPWVVGGPGPWILGTRLSEGQTKNPNGHHLIAHLAEQHRYCKFCSL